MYDRKHPADAMYAALSPRAPVYVDAPVLGAMRATALPSRSELLRQQIAAAQALCSRGALGV
jgi:hypothetical protein